MKPILKFLSLVALTQCTGFKLPKPGEPVRNDIDARSQLRDSDAQTTTTRSDRYPDAEAQSAYDSGYSAGYLDHQRGNASDPESHLNRVNPIYRTPFVTGYVSGFNQ